MCPKGHALEKSSEGTGFTSWPCNHCNKDSDQERWACLPCGWNVCVTCMEQQMNGSRTLAIGEFEPLSKFGIGKVCFKIDDDIVKFIILLIH